MSFSGKKVDMWASFKPPEELTREYDLMRDQSALDVNKRIVETGTFRNPAAGSTAEKKLPIGERHLDEQIIRYGPSIREYLSVDANATINALAGHIALSHQQTARLLGRMKLRLKPGKNVRK